MTRKRYEWKLKSRSIQLGDRTLIAGILNVTPDSFSDGGKYNDPDRAFARALELEEEGADIIDIGAESTRPGSVRISEAEELRRLVPVLKRLKEKLAVPISVDTYKSGVAVKALELGAEIINDPSALTFDPQLSRAVAQHDAGLILNHMRGTPESWAKLPPLPDVMGAILHDLEASVHRARGAGVERARIVVDPGLGFGKRKEQNSDVIARLGQLHRLDLPIFIAPSRKSFLAQQTERLTSFATASAVAASILSGAHIVRVHEVREMRAVAEVADAVLQAMPSFSD
ncbi:MAG: dihydropteroate synthase [Bryobacteraceae bacterium]